MPQGGYSFLCGRMKIPPACRLTQSARAEGAFSAKPTFVSNLTVLARVIGRRLEKALLNALYPKPH